MQHDMTFKKTGKCFVCGEDTRLLIHQECGKKMDALRKKTKKVKKYNSSYINHLAKGGDS